jgi:hypothetical protein
MAQRLAQSLGVALSAFILHLAAPTGHLTFFAFDVAFLVVAALALASVPAFARLRHDAGAELAGRVTREGPPKAD